MFWVIWDINFGRFSYVGYEAWFEGEDWGAGVGGALVVGEEKHEFGDCLLFEVVYVFVVLDYFGDGKAHISWRDIKRVAYTSTRKDFLIKLLREVEDLLIFHSILIGHTYHVFCPCISENLACKLRMTRSHKHKVKSMGVAVFDIVFQFLLRDKVRFTRTFLILKNQRISLMVKILEELTTKCFFSVWNSMTREVKSHQLFA